MDVDERTAELKAKKICRFCMTTEEKLLSNIYSRENRLKNSVPLPLQIMACVSIEVIIAFFFKFSLNFFWLK